MPCSGKTNSYNKIKKTLTKKKKNFTSYIDVFYNYVQEIVKLSILESIFLKIHYKIYKNNLKNLNYNFKKTSIKRKNNSNYKKLKILSRKTVNEKVEKIKKKVFTRFRPKEKKALKILLNCVEKTPIGSEEKIRLKNRVEQEIIGAFILKKRNLINTTIINDEGLIQRVISGYSKKLNMKLNIKLMKKNVKFILNNFQINLFIYNKVSNQILLNRSKKRINGFKYSDNNNLDMWKSLFEVFYKKYKNNICKADNFKQYKIMKIINNI